MTQAWPRWCLVVLVAAACGQNNHAGPIAAPPDSGGDGGGPGDDGGGPARGGPAEPPVLDLLAGTIGGVGNADDSGTSARFSFPRGVAADSVGNVYVTDSLNGTVRKITAAGIVTTFAGTPSEPGIADGTGAAARFITPTGVAVDAAGNVYVADSFSNTIRKITPEAVVTTLAGTPRTSGPDDGTGPAARFNTPTGVAVDSAGNLYVADTDSATVRKITAEGIVTTLAGHAGLVGSADGAGADARFSGPTGVAVDGAGNVYVTDNRNSTVRKITPTGTVSTLAGTPGVAGNVDGPIATAQFDVPYALAVDGAGNVYVSDAGGQTVRKITSAGEVATLAGAAGLTGSEDGGATARFNTPTGVAVDSANNLYIADLGNSTIRKITSDGLVTTFAGTARASGSEDGASATARFSAPQNVVVDAAGTIYVADESNHTVRAVTPAGEVTTFAGAAGLAGSVNGPRADARFDEPDGVALDQAGNLYITEFANATIRKIGPDGIVTTLAGAAHMRDSVDGAGAAARFSTPIQAAFDSHGNAYVADMLNSTIRKITPTGTVTTFAGAAGVTGSADGTAARFRLPRGLAIDSADNVYVADTDNATIRKITPDGIATTLAGTAEITGSADGAGAAARFNEPQALALDRAGNIYVADGGNATIRKITPAGVTTTVAGIPGVTGIALGATPRFQFPVGLVVAGDALVITDVDAVLLLRHVVQ